MGLPCHFDPFVRQYGNTIYHPLNHSDLVGGAQFHRKNICGLITTPPNLSPRQLKACLQDGKDAGRQLETNLKFLLKWEMPAREISASSITVIKHDRVIFYASFRIHKKNDGTTIYLNFAECITLKPILMLADKGIVGVL